MPASQKTGPRRSVLGTPSRARRPGTGRACALPFPPRSPTGRPDPQGKGERIRYATFPSALGHVLVASTERGLCAVKLGSDAQKLARLLRAAFAAAEISQAPLPQLEGEIRRFIDGETGLISDGLGLVPGEKVTVFGVDNNGFVDASTVRINGGVGALNDVMLNGVVSLANPGLGGFVLTQEAQPTMVMLTPQTVIEENAVPVGITAIAPAEPVTVLGTVSNGVFVADRVMIAG